MEKIFPNREQAHMIWEEGIAYRLTKDYGFVQEKEYRFHTQGVANAAAKIAAYLPEIDPDKAYVFGLLHDYGKHISQLYEHKFHGQEGYECMLKMGYPEIAQICLTHTFPEKDFNSEQYSFPEEWFVWIREHIAKLEYSDYDLLIAFCDKLFETFAMVTVENRVKAIVERYGLNEHQRNLLYTQSIKLKNYFDDKTGKNVYDILQIKD